MSRQQPQRPALADDDIRATLSLQNDRDDEYQFRGKRNYGSLAKNRPSETTVVNTIDTVYHQQPEEVMEAVAAVHEWHSYFDKKVEDPRLRKNRVEPDEPQIKVHQPRRTLETKDGVMNQQAKAILDQQYDPALMLKLRSLEDQLRARDRDLALTEKEFVVLHQLKSNTQAVKILSTPLEQRSQKQQRFVETLLEKQAERATNPLLRGKFVADVQQTAPKGFSKSAHVSETLASGIDMANINNLNVARHEGKKRWTDPMGLSTVPYVTEPGAVVPKRAKIPPTVHRNLAPILQFVERSFVAGRDAPTAKTLHQSKHLAVEEKRIVASIPVGTRPRGSTGGKPQRKRSVQEESAPRGEENDGATATDAARQLLLQRENTLTPTTATSPSLPRVEDSVSRTPPHSAAANTMSTNLALPTTRSSNPNISASSAKRSNNKGMSEALPVPKTVTFRA